MAQIDTSTLENFGEMSADELREFISSYEIPESDDKIKYTKLKSSFDKTASELAAAKRTIRASQSAEEQAKADREAEMKEMKDKYDALLRESTIAKNAQKFSGLLGKDGEAAALAFADGDIDKVVELFSKAKTDFEKSIRADVTKNSPRPDDVAGKGTNFTSKEDIMKIKDATERQAAITEHPELFGITSF